MHELGRLPRRFALRKIPVMLVLDEALSDGQAERVSE